MKGRVVVFVLSVDSISRAYGLTSSVARFYKSRDRCFILFVVSFLFIILYLCVYCNNRVHVRSLGHAPVRSKISYPDISYFVSLI